MSMNISISKLNEISNVKSTRIPKNKPKPYPTNIIVGFALILLYLIQYYFQIKFEYFTHLQENFNYKVSTGLVLFFYIYMQWQLFRIRENEVKSTLRNALAFHKWQGALLPIILYIHATNLGYGYQLILSYSLLITVLTGLISPQITKIQKKQVYFSWLVIHIVFASICFLLVFYHLYIVFSY